MQLAHQKIQKTAPDHTQPPYVKHQRSTKPGHTAEKYQQLFDLKELKNAKIFS